MFSLQCEKKKIKKKITITKQTNSFEPTIFFGLNTKVKMSFLIVFNQIFFF